MEKIQFSISKNALIGILSFIAGVLIAYIVFLLVASATQPAIIPHDQTQIPNGTSQNQVEQDVTITPSTTNPDENVFTSKLLGVTFSYLKYSYSFDENNPGINRAVNTPTPTVEGQTIRFADQATVTVYQKAPGDSLETGISKQFLAGIPQTKCLPVRVNTTTDSMYTPGSGISYITLYAVVPGGCPSQFDTANPSAAFVSFASRPDVFLYVTGTIDGTMPILTATGDPFWTTMRFNPTQPSVIH